MIFSILFICCFLLNKAISSPSVFLVSPDNICLGSNLIYKCSVGTVAFNFIAVIINGTVYNEIQLVNTFNNQITFVAGNSGLDGAGNVIDVHANITVSNISTIYNNTEIGCSYPINASIRASLIFTLPVPPATAPSITTATALGAVCGVTLTWTASYSEFLITNYTLYQNSSVINTTATTSYSISQLTAGETYSYTVLASTCMGGPPLSQDKLFMTPINAGISATNCTATYDAMSYVFTLVFTQPLQDYPISYIINISSVNSTQLFTTSSTILTAPVYTTVLMLDTAYSYTASITAVLHCPSASNVTCSTDVTIIPIPTTAATTTTTTTTTTAATAAAATTSSTSSVTNTDISTSDFPITNSMDTANTNLTLSGSSTTSMQNNIGSSKPSPPGPAFSASVIIASSVTIIFVVLVLIILVIIVVIVIIVLNKRAKAKSAQSGANTNNYTNNNTINNKQLTYADLDLVNISSDVKQQIPRSNYAAIDQTKLD